MQKFALIVALVVVLVGCGKQEVTGQVFVVTQGKNNIKLALVAVGAIPQEEFDQYLKTKQREKLEQQKLLLPKYEHAKKEVDEVQKKREEIWQKEKQKLIEPEKKDKEAQAEFDKNVNQHTLRKAVIASNNYIKALNESSNEASEEIKKYINKQANLDLINKYEAFNKNEFYLQDLPAPKFISKTDADGKFALSLPKGKYVITANSSRSVGSSSEAYLWLVWVDTSPPNQWLLSNDNLFETKCNECVKF